MAPTLSELGFSDVEVPNWRSVVAPPTMSEAAKVYWSSVLAKVAQSDAWTNGYLDKYKLVGDYMDWQKFKAYADKFQADYLSPSARTNTEIRPSVPALAGTVDSPP